MRRDDGSGVQGSDDKDDRVAKAYEFLKEFGWVAVGEVEDLYGKDAVEELRRRGLLQSINRYGIEYVTAK